MTHIRFMEMQKDEELILQVMRGDTDALGPLVTRHHSPLLGYLYRMLGGNRALAEDLVQETFLRVLEQDNYQAGRPFKPWLYSIATHLAHDHFRAANTRHSAVMPFHMLELSDETAGPEAQALLTNQADAVADAFSELGPEYASTLILRFYNGMSLDEIKETLNVPLGTVKSRLSVGTQRLRKLLTERLKENQP